MLMSVDGKISTGDTVDLDFDRDLPKVSGAREGLHQYYDLEKQTDLFSLNTGRVMAKIGINERAQKPKKALFSFVIIDNQPHITLKGVEYLSQWLTKLILVTTNADHHAILTPRENVVPVVYKNEVDFVDLFGRLKVDHGIERLTIQSGGTLNAVLLRQNLIDHISIVVAPVLVGGKTTPTLVDGEALHTLEDLVNLKALKLTMCCVIMDSYIHLRYDIINPASSG